MTEDIPIFVGIAQRRIGVLKLSHAQQVELTSFAKLLLMDGDGFRKPSFLVQKTGTIRPQVIHRHYNLIPEGWPYFRKMQQEAPDLPAAELIERFCLDAANDNNALAFEKNMFRIRLVEHLRAALKEGAPLAEADSVRAGKFLEGLNVPDMVTNPMRVYSGEEFEVRHVVCEGTLVPYVETRGKDASR